MRFGGRRLSWAEHTSWRGKGKQAHNTGLRRALLESVSTARSWAESSIRIGAGQGQSTGKAGAVAPHLFPFRFQAAQPHARRRVPARNRHTSEASAALDLGRRRGQARINKRSRRLCTRRTAVRTQPNGDGERARCPRFHGAPRIVSAAGPPASSRRLRDSARNLAPQRRVNKARCLQRRDLQRARSTRWQHLVRSSPAGTGSAGERLTNQPLSPPCRRIMSIEDEKAKSRTRTTGGRARWTGHRPS